MSREFIEVLPDPERITESLRDTGYSLNAAIEDILDNSIAAGANKVSIQFDLNPKGEVVFRITDNGHGMNRDGLLNALTYGSQRRDNGASLGKFGLGLKTASTAFAKKLRVVSRTPSSQALAGTWDLDLVKSEGWKVEISPEVKKNEIVFLDAVAGPNEPGTIVQWMNVDRVLPRQYKDPTGRHAKKGIDNLKSSLRSHLEMVYQRFLDPDDSRAMDVEIELNGNLIKAWDPFQYGGDPIVEEVIPVNVDADTVGEMKIRAFALPRKADMIAKYGQAEHANSRLKNEYQGIYVYREHRVIHGPDWLGLWSQEPHTTNFRVELSFDHKLDEAFQIDIKKSRILMEQQLLNEVKSLLTPPRRQAEEIYRNAKKENSKKVSDESIHDPSNVTIGEKSPTIPASKVESVDDEKKKANISNEHGTVTVDYEASPDNKVYIKIVDELDDGLLYKPTYIGKNPGVLVNSSHPYYSKVYLPNKNSGVAIQGLDSMMWALASAEFRSLQDDLKRLFEDIRYDVSKALKRLVEDLPEPEEHSDI